MTDTKSSGFNWGDILSSAFSATVSGVGNYLANEQQQDLLNQQYAREDEIRAQDLAQARENQALELRLAALKAMYGSGGGGGSGPFTGITDAQKVGAMQAQGELKQQSIQNALQSLQAAYQLGVRY